MIFGVADILAVFTLAQSAQAELKPREVSAIPGFDYENDKIRGVNLGGWFVLEPYMNPSLFNSGWENNQVPVDEYEWCKFHGKDKAKELLENHWNTWITEKDFEEMASYGVNLARIPIGYWAVLQRDEDPYVQGQIPYFDKALEWARNHKVKVWVDLHGAPGSQNGFDNSGLRGHYEWQTDENIKDTYTALQKLIDHYGGSEYNDVIIGIELINEPLGPILDMDKLHDYYNKGYEMLRKKSVDQGVIVHDAFKPIDDMNSWLNLPDYYNVVMDHHRYQCFELAQLKYSIDEHVDHACKIGTELKEKKNNKWRVVGEWSAALTDCTPLLNGVYRGARYDGSYDNQPGVGSCEGIGNIAEWSDEHKADTRKYIEAQLDAYEHGSSGWIFWAWKTESAIEWDYQKLVQFGLMPNPITDRQHNNQCGY